MSEMPTEESLEIWKKDIFEVVIKYDFRILWSYRAPELFARFKSLFLEDPEQFFQLCTILLTDEKDEVVYGTLGLIQSFTSKEGIKRNSRLAILVAQCALARPNVTEAAVGALNSIAPRAALPAAFYFARRGYADGISLMETLVQTPEQIAKGVQIARTYLDAETYDQREAALFYLQRYSTADQELDVLLHSAGKYYDELVIGALESASPALALEPVKQLRQDFVEKYPHPTQFAHYWDFSNAIEALEEKRGLVPLHDQALEQAVEEIAYIAAQYYEESKNEAISEGSPELALELVFRLRKAFEDMYPDFTRYALYWRLSKALYDAERAV